MIQSRMDAARKRLLYYLLLNAIVSACVTASVLFVYDRYFHTPTDSPAASAPVQTAEGASKVEISVVIGAGIPSSEKLVLRNTGQEEASLEGWKLQDEQNNVYTFPKMTVASGGVIQINTAPGKDTLIDLYWGLTAPVWSSGETATLLDPAGTVKSVYKVP